MLRQARLDAPGTLHHVIIRGIEQRQIVDVDEDWKNFVDRMGSLGLQTEPAIYAWALTQIGTNPRSRDFTGHYWAPMLSSLRSERLPIQRVLSSTTFI